jgi:phosphate transport system permease protein
MERRIIIDKIAARTMLGLTVISVLLAVLIAGGLYLRSQPLLETQSIGHLLSSSEWKPSKGEFGFFPFIMGTLWVTAIAILIALPLCILTSVYLSEYAHHRMRKLLVPFIDMLSGIPPIVFGVWGVLFVVPLIREYIGPYFSGNASGYSVLAGGIVLAIMIAPMIITVLLEVFSTVPKELKDASLSLGATKWQTVKFVLLKKSRPGIIAASVLAISRAFGETIAVMMVCGNTVQAPHSPLDAGYPLPALIANNYGEMLSVKLYDSALLFAALILFVIIFLFNAVARYILSRIERSMT